MTADRAIQKISVIVPDNPFAPPDMRHVKHCLAALDVQKLMEWWPGKPHVPKRNLDKVRAIQRSLDWKRVAHIAAYLLQDEITEAPSKLDKYFSPIYRSLKSEPGREWPPRVPQVVGYEKSRYPTFSNVLLHVNGAQLGPKSTQEALGTTAVLTFDEDSADLNFSVIDGQHRINGAYFAVMIKQESAPNARWEIPSEIFLDLDKPGEPPRNQAQIFIDVNFNQKKVDRSLVADLFPTARAGESSLGHKERAQDLGRKLMLERGPLVNMVQIPGIRFGVKDVITLATLNAAIEDQLPLLDSVGITSLQAQTEVFATCLDAWLLATGRTEDENNAQSIGKDNVVYQGRVLQGFLSLLPACLLFFRSHRLDPSTERSRKALAEWLHKALARAGLLKGNEFLRRADFQKKGFLGSGGIGRFRDTLWAAAFANRSVARLDSERIADLASQHQSKTKRTLSVRSSR